MIVSERYDKILNYQSSTYTYIRNSPSEKFVNCKKCGINLIELPAENKEKILRTCCLTCDSIPFLIIGVTHIAGFRSAFCKKKWYLRVVEKKKEKPILASIEGSVLAKIEDQLSRFCLNGNFIKGVEAYYPSKTKIYGYLLEVLTKIASEEIENNTKGMGFFNDELNKVKEKVNKKVRFCALIYALRIYNNMENNGEFFAFQSKIKTETSVLFPFICNDGKFLVRGRIDKLYELPDTVVFVRDDKLKERITVDNFKQIEQDCSEQLGGYSKGLRFMGKTVPIVGVMWLSSYFEMNPIVSDERGWESSALEVARVLKYSISLSPKHNGNLCRRYCGFSGLECN